MLGADITTGGGGTGTATTIGGAGGGAAAVVPPWRGAGHVSAGNPLGRVCAGAVGCAACFAGSLAGGVVDAGTVEADDAGA